MLYETANPDTLLLAQGVFDTVQNLGEEATTTLRVLSIPVAIGFFIFISSLKRFAMGAMIVGGLVAGIFIWIVFNVTTVKDRVGEDLEAAPAPVVAEASAFPVT